MPGARPRFGSPLRAIVWVATAAAYFAIIQTVVFYASGINIFPIIRANDTLETAYIMDAMFRATSFVGEPKHLGILMSLGLTAFFLARVFRVRTGRLAWHKPLVMVGALLLSLSTTGMVLSAVCLGLLSPSLFRRLRQLDKLVLVVFIAIGAYQISSIGGRFNSLLGQQASKLHFEVQDQSVQEALLDNPGFAIVGTGLGNIHLIAVQYLPANFPLFREEGYKANSGLFDELGDAGLIGLLLLIAGPFLAAIAFQRNRRLYTRKAQDEAFAGVSLIMVIMIGFLLRYNELYFLVAGFVFARLAELEKGISTALSRSAGLREEARPGSGHRACANDGHLARCWVF